MRRIGHAPVSERIARQKIAELVVKIGLRRRFPRQQQSSQEQRGQRDDHQTEKGTFGKPHQRSLNGSKEPVAERGPEDRQQNRQNDQTGLDEEEIETRSE